MGCERCGFPRAGRRGDLPARSQHSQIENPGQGYGIQTKRTRTASNDIIPHTIRLHNLARNQRREHARRPWIP
jgi:hypothetical protein